MANEGLNKLGEFKTESGEVVGQMFSAPNALSGDADVISQCLYYLTELLVRGLLPDQRGGGLGGEFGYGVNFENDVFLMFRECWCDGEPGCKKCEGEFPNFRHKASGFEVDWYKWIGRDMKMNRDSISGEEWHTIFNECIESIPKEARDRAKAEHDFENTPEYLAEQKATMSHMMEVMMNPQKYNAPPEKRECHNCKAVEYGEPSWTEPMFWQCDKCRKSGRKLFDSQD